MLKPFSYIRSGTLIYLEALNESIEMRVLKVREMSRKYEGRTGGGGWRERFYG